MIAFDSNILIYVLENDPCFGDKAVDVFYEIEQVGGICSSLIITEAMRAPIISKSLIGPLLSRSVTILPVTEQIAEMAGVIKIEHGLKNVDSIHIATAIAGGATEFVTNDKKLSAKKIRDIKIRAL